MSVQQMFASYGYKPNDEGGSGDFPAGLSLWARYKASSVSYVGDGNSISQWDDISGNGRHAVQPNQGNRPTLKTSTTGLVGNTTSIRFQGSSDSTKSYFILPDMSNLLGAEMFLFLRIDSGSQKNRLYLIGTARDGYYPYAITGASSGLGVYDNFGRSSRIDNIFPPSKVPSATWHTLDVWSFKNDWGMIIDESSIYNTTAAFDPSFRSEPRLGADYDGSAYQGSMNANLVEAVICDTKTSLEQRSLLSSYFRSEYLGQI